MSEIALAPIEPVLLAPSVTRPRSVSLPAISGGKVFGPNLVKGTPPALALDVWDDGSHVATLDGRRNTAWTDEIDGIGNLSFELANDDPDIAALQPGRVVVVSKNGVQRFGGRIESRNITTHVQSEEAGSVTKVRCPGRLEVFAKSLIFPPNGVGALPVVETRSASWVTRDFDHSSWPNAKRIHRSDQPDRPPQPTPPVYWIVPEWWPARSSWWIWADRDDCSQLNAPAGNCCFWWEGELSAGTIRIFFAADNGRELFFDGISAIEFSETDRIVSRPNTFVGASVDYEITEGTHSIAVHGVNTAAPGINPGKINVAVFSLDENGLLDELLVKTDSDWKALPYPDPMPMISPGRVIRLRLEEAQARGELLGVTLGFTDTLDSGGNPWILVPEITMNVKQPLVEVLLAMSDATVDLAMAPGSDLLFAWNWGTRGRASTDVEIADTGDRATSEVVSAEHDERNTRCNHMLIRYAKNYTEISDDDSIEEHGRVSSPLELGNIQDEGEAQRVARSYMELRKDPTVATSLTLRPVTSRPYDDFQIGDVVEHPGPSGQVSSRVRSISAKEDENGVVLWDLELNDTRREQEDRLQNWLERMAPGTLAGGARAVSRAGDPLPKGRNITTHPVAEFHCSGPLSEAPTWSDIRPATETSSVIEFYGELTEPGTTETRVRVYANGEVLGSVSPAGTIVFLPGVTEAQYDLGFAKAYKNQTKFRMELVEVGDGAEGLNLQVRGLSVS